MRLSRKVREVEISKSRIIHFFFLFSYIKGRRELNLPIPHKTLSYGGWLIWRSEWVMESGCRVGEVLFTYLSVPLSVCFRSLIL